MIMNKIRIENHTSNSRVLLHFEQTVQTVQTVNIYNTYKLIN